MLFLNNFLTGFAGPILLLILIVSYLSKNLPALSRSLIILPSIFLFVLIFFGLRTEWSGADTSSYVTHFIEVQTKGERGEMFEIGYEVFVYFLASLFDYQAYLAISAFLSLLLIVFAAHNLGIKNIALVLILYISLLPGFDMMSNGLRQGFVVSLSAFIITTAFRSRLASSLIILPYFFHKSAIVYIFSFLIPNKIINYKRIKKLVIVGVLAAFCTKILISGSDFSFARYLNIPLIGSSATLGQKLDMYIYIEKQLLSESMILYFLLISLAILFPFYQCLFTEKVESPFFLKFAFIVVFIHVLYLMFWWTNYSYRFMYMSYLLSILLSILSVEKSGNSRGELYLYMLALLGVVTTYGSSTFSKFSFVL